MGEGATVPEGDPVGVLDGAEEVEIEGEDVNEEVPHRVAVTLGLDDVHRVAETELVALRLRVGEPVREGEPEGLNVCVPVMLAVEIGVAQGVEVKEAVAQADAQLEGEAELVKLACRDDERVPVGLDEEDRQLETEGDRVEDAEREKELVPVRDRVTVADTQAVTVVVAVDVAQLEMDTVDEGVAVMHVLCD